MNQHLFENQNNSYKDNDYPLSIPTTSSDSIELVHKETKIEYKQDYFKCFGKTRRFPDPTGLCGIVTTFLLFFFGSCIFEAICISLATSELSKDYSFSTKPFIISAVISSFTYILSQITYFDVTTSIPGYQTTNKMSEEEYKKSPPTIEYNGKTFILKYCPTCKLVRNVRTFHCKYCNMCIERHDHHCGYMSNCIGKNNTKKFVWFLIAAGIHCLVVVCVSLYVFGLIYVKFGNKEELLGEVSLYTMFSGVLIIFAGFFLVFIICMISSHVSMILKNETTNEDIRKKYDNSVFDKGKMENCKEVFCVVEEDFDPEEWKKGGEELAVK